MSTEKFSQRQFQHKDVEIMERKVVYQGFFQMQQHKLRHRLFDGGWTEPLTREVFERGHAVVVLPYDPRRDELVLLEQFRVGAMDSKESPWLIELVAGMVEPGETPETVAHREAEEEAGLQLHHLEFMLSYLVSPGGTTERISLYVADVDATDVNGVFGLATESEDIRVHTVQRSEALQLLNAGRIDNAATVIALQWLALHGDSLRLRWNATQT